LARQIDHAVVGVIVEQDGKILVVKEGKPERGGKYNAPGGHVEEHETLLEAAVREVKEETGYDVELTGLIGVYQTIFPHLNVSGPVFAARVISGEATISEEHPEVKWISFEELKALDKARRLFTRYSPHAAKMLLDGKILPLEAVVCETLD